MASQARTTLELQVGPLSPGELRVFEVRGREALSRPFRWEVTWERRDHDPVGLEDLVGEAAQLVLRRADGAERFVHGVCASAELLEVRAGKPVYRVALVPRLALLAWRHDCRAFQGQSVPEIVGEVLDAGEVAWRDALSGSYPPREYCLQYRETDLAFVERLLAEEGIVYFFEHADGAHTLVLGDAPGAFADVPGEATLPYRPPDAAGDQAEHEHVHAVARTARAQVAKVTLRDFDFAQPALDLTASASAADGPEDYGYRLRSGEPDDQRRLAASHLEALRLGLCDYPGEATSLRLLPGACFELSEHPDPAFCRRLALVEVEVEARQVEAAGEAEAIQHRLVARFRARPDDARPRPPLPQRRPLVPGAQSATVVGPGGEEIHVDEHGRIKVQFHWDRQGARDDRSSCFVRVAQGWAGAGFGRSVVPRVGQEVLVRFHDGDPDKPVVVGALYNGAHPPPATLPDERTQSTLRSDSSPGGDGANELRFEDLKDQERVHLHAQKDETIRVEHDKRQRVGRSEALQVQKDRSREVDGNQRLQVALQDQAKVERSQTLTVAGSRTTAVVLGQQEAVTATQSAQVARNRNVVVGQASAETVLLASALTVGGAYAVSVAAVMNEAVGGLRASQIGGAHVELVGLSRDERVGKDSSATTGGDAVADVSGALTMVVGKDQNEQVGGKTGVEVKEAAGILSKKIELSGDSELRVVVGGTLLLSVKSSGVTFTPKTFSVDASGDVKLKGSKVSMAGGASPPSAKPEVARLDPLTGESAFVQVKVTDQDGQPIANELVRVEFSDGTVKEARLDGSGQAKVSGPKPGGTAKVSLPNLDAKVWKLGKG